MTGQISYLIVQCTLFNSSCFKVSFKSFKSICISFIVCLSQLLLPKFLRNNPEAGRQCLYMVVYINMSLSVVTLKLCSKIVQEDFERFLKRKKWDIVRT